MDRISNLPLNIIETILCLLPYHEVARTSTLSKEWRYHWTKIPKIRVIVNRQTLNRSKISCGLGQAMLMHEGPIHEVVVAGDWDCEREIDCIISHLSIKKTVKKLSIDFRHHSIPISVFSMSQLTHLCLNYCDLSHEPRFIWRKPQQKSQTSWLPSSGLGSLTSLYVQNSHINIETLLHILSNCPFLKSVTLKTHKFYDRDGTTITSLFESLKTIESLTIWREIIEVLARDSNQGRIPKEVPVTLVHIKSLCMGHIYLDGYYGLQIIALFIRSSPNIEKLTMNIRDEEAPCFRSIDQNFSDIRLVHLRIFEITNLSSMKTELNIVKLILMRSPVLKKLRIHITEDYKVDEMLISETILSAPRASPVVEFNFKNEPF